MFTIGIIQADHETAVTIQATAGRSVIHRTRGRGHGEVFRLVSPNDLGQQLNPSSSLDSFGGVISEFAAAGGMHPHSGIRTITVFTRGDVHFDDPDAGSGYIGYGGGVWHGKELSSGKFERIHGF